MIPLNELRVGLWVTDNGELTQVDLSMMSRWNELDPVELNEEWFEVFGFEKETICIMSQSAAKWHEKEEKGSSLDKAFGKEGIYLVRRKDWYRWEVYKYTWSNTGEVDYVNLQSALFVHQLQNIYFTIIRQELLTPQVQL